MFKFIYKCLYDQSLGQQKQVIRIYRLQKMEKEQGKFQGRKGEAMIRMECSNTDAGSLLHIQLLDPIDFEAYDAFIDQHYLEEKAMVSWFENPQELMTYFRQQFDEVVLTGQKSLMFTILINPKLNKQKNFAFALSKRPPSANILGKQQSKIDKHDSHSKQLSVFEQVKLLQRHHQSSEWMGQQVDIRQGNRAYIKLTNDKAEQGDFIYCIFSVPNSGKWRYQIRVIKITEARLAVKVGTDELLTSNTIVPTQQEKASTSFRFDSRFWYGFESSGKGVFTPLHLKDNSRIWVDIDEVEWNLIFWLDEKIQRICSIPQIIRDQEILLQVLTYCPGDQIELSVSPY